MKLRVPEIVKKMTASLAPMQKLVLISLAAWVTHIILRVLLLFRNNPYGFPFVSKPDWFIFHAVCIDFMWIVNALVVFLVISAIAIKITDVLKSDKAKSVIQKTLTVLYAVFHGAILFLTLLDNETQRFLGGHLTFGLVDTYKDTSSIVVFYDYVANDLSVPYLQFVVLLLMLPLTYGVYKLLCKWYRPAEGFYVKKSVIAMLIFYIASYSYVYIIWTGSSRMDKLCPVVSLIYNDLFSAKRAPGLTEADLGAYRTAYQNLWQKIEGDSDWNFSDAKEGGFLWRVRQ